MRRNGLSRGIIITKILSAINGILDLNIFRGSEKRAFDKAIKELLLRLKPHFLSERNSSFIVVIREANFSLNKFRPSPLLS